MSRYKQNLCLQNWDRLQGGNPIEHGCLVHVCTVRADHRGSHVCGKCGVSTKPVLQHPECRSCRHYEIARRSGGTQ